MVEIPLLNANDVELRVGRMLTGAVVLLAYKDARVDMRVLDDVFGWQNWKREHTVIDGQLYCTVSVWDQEKGQWISKQDVGTESQTEAEKGRASDSFKRACFNFGIGRELYAAPFLYIKLTDADMKKSNNGKTVLKTRFKVHEMFFDRDRGEFTKFTVVDDKGHIRFSLTGKTGGSVNPDTTQPQDPDGDVPPPPAPDNENRTITELEAHELITLAKRKGVTEEQIVTGYKMQNIMQLPVKLYKYLTDVLSARKDV